MSKHPGTVTGDEQAFRQISSRFREEVGRLLAKIDFTTGPLPYWALIRMMFPVAESLGDLIYRKNDATAQNLRSVLETDFEAVRTGYAGRAAVLALLYRHSLTHHDELRTIRSGAREIGWFVNGADDGTHLSIHRTGNQFMIEFQPRAFYADICGVCERAAGLSWGGEVMLRYNGWMSLDLDVAIKKPNARLRAARDEIANF